MAKPISRKGHQGFISNAEEGAISSGNVDVWNVAEGYVKLKILRPLIQLDRYEIISQYGTEEIDQEIFLSDNDISKRRIEAFNRFISTLKQLIGNVKFALKMTAQDEMKEYLERLENVENVKDNIFYENENQITHERELVINEDLFRRCLKIMLEIKDDVNKPINKAGLIFREGDEVDLDKIMKDIIEGG